MALDINRTKDTERIMRTKKYKAIRDDLMDQLESYGTVGEHHADLIDDYMDMYVTKCLLVKDIQERGVIIHYNNGGGQYGTKKNDSVEQRIKINTQMLKLLSELGIKPSQAGGEDDAL